MNPCTLNINYLLKRSFKLLSCDHLYKILALYSVDRMLEGLLIILQLYYEV